MKTNVLMQRTMGGLLFTQRTKDSYFSATQLLSQWNKLEKTAKKDREVSRFLHLDTTQNFINELVDAEIIHTHLEGYHTSRANKGENAGTWMHPYLFIKFAMWLSPKFEVECIKFIHDSLIANRKLAGTNYSLLSSSGMKLKGYNFSEIAIAMQWIVFGSKGKNLRQTASEDQLKELYELEQKLSFAIDMGYIKTYEQLLSEMRKIWNQKNRKF
jgi:hypothetical protein